MKKVFILFLVNVSLTIHAQETKKAITTNPLKNANDSTSYAIGIGIGNFYGQQGVNHLNTALIAKAIQDVFGKKNVLLDDDHRSELHSRSYRNTPCQGGWLR